jgi:hypothetical protein
LPQISQFEVSASIHKMSMLIKAEILSAYIPEVLRSNVTRDNKYHVFVHLSQFLHVTAHSTMR